MAKGDFKHIQVTAAEEDEVIIAGVGAPADSMEPTVGQAPKSEPMAQQPPASQSSQVAPSPAQPERPATTSKPTKSSSKGVKKKDDYHETTLEDLQGTPMPLAQKIVIIAAVVCIIGALVYYFAVMR